MIVPEGVAFCLSLSGIFCGKGIHKIFMLEFAFSVAKPLEISYNTMMKYFGLHMLEMGGEVRWPYDRGGS